MLTILYFARLRETLGLEREILALPADVGDVATLTKWLMTRGDNWRALDPSNATRCAVNQQLASADTPLNDGDEVAYFPPVTGG